MNVQEVSKLINAYHNERLCTKHFYVELLNLGFNEYMSLSIINTELEILHLKHTDLETLDSPVVLDHEPGQCYWSEDALENFKETGSMHHPHKKHDYPKGLFSNVKRNRRKVKATHAGPGQEDTEDKALKELYDSRREPSHTGVYRAKNDPHFRENKKAPKKD